MERQRRSQPIPIIAGNPQPGTQPGSSSMQQPPPPARFAMGTIENPPARVAEPTVREEDVVQIVHDLRDPLATLALETYVLDRKLAVGDHSDVRCSVARMLRNIEFLDRLVQDLLDSCSVYEESFALHRKPTELRALLQQVIDRIAPLADQGRILLQAAYPITIAVDELRIERVVANLLGNALKHSPKSSVIVVCLEAGALSAQISVTDAGPGITQTERDHIFEKYYRGATSHGMGLGLYVSKRIVEAHGGQIGVDSTPGVGSRFYFDLPATPP